MMENHRTMKCKCGSKDCRGFHLLPETVKKRYLKLRIVQEFIVRGIGQVTVNEIKRQYAKSEKMIVMSSAHFV